MRIHALTTGTVEIKTAMERGWGAQPLRLARALLDRKYTPALPIHAWLIEHPDGPLLIDAGELASSPDMPIARFHVHPEQEIDAQLAEVGVQPRDLSAVILTHLHGDHTNGLARLGGARVRAHRAALTRSGRRRLHRLGVEAEPLDLTPEPFGAWERSVPLTADGAVLAVPVPGHARGQIAVAVIEDGRHVLLAADSAYSEAQLLDEHPDGVSVSPRQALASMRTILAHSRRHPTVVLPSHDPESATRLAERSVLRPG